RRHRDGSTSPTPHRADIETIPMMSLRNGNAPDETVRGRESDHERKSRKSHHITDHLTEIESLIDIEVATPMPHPPHRSLDHHLVRLLVHGLVTDRSIGIGLEVNTSPLHGVLWSPKSR